ncbi:hypothetical protein [Bradyrhizobium sp. 145]|uniref:hypothetical protein n=1 Tax=Bradyrhizobium sp. 145 TaxID=2782621 RepID=UPI001FF7EFCD|nr:hypothetical protein [Bradyrhizobium sp. 145]
MLQEGMSLATLMDTMFSAPMAQRDAVRYVASALDDFAITPELSPSGIFVTLYDDQPGSFRVIDIERCPAKTFGFGCPHN